MLTIRKRVKKKFHLWMSMIFMISTNNVRMFALIDNDFNQNFIDQRFAYEWRLNANENSSTNSQTMNETSLKMFKSHLLKFSSKRNDEKISKIEQNLMSTHMIEVNVILKMSWLKKINSIVNWSTNKWRFKKNFEASSNISRDAANKQKSKYFKKTSDFYIA
jgi:inorganic triphosphatase YgiF